MVELRDEEDGRVALIMGREELPLAIEALMRAGYELRSPSQDGAEASEGEDEEPEDDVEELEDEDEEPEYEDEEPEDEDEDEDEDEEPEEPEEPERRSPVRRRASRARRLRADATSRSDVKREEGGKGPMVELKDEEDGRVSLIVDKEELPFAVEGLMRAGYGLTPPPNAESEEE